MQFSTKEWPLLATHIMCLFLGVAFANISYEPCLQKTLSPYKILIPVHPKQFMFISSKKIYDTQKVMLARFSEKRLKISCLETESFGKMRVQEGLFFLESSKSVSSFYLKLVTEKRGKFFLIPYERALLYNVCERKAEVTYGS